MDIHVEPKYEVNHAKLKDVVHFVCSQCRREELGNVKLHKILYFADMIHYISCGKPLTGVEYQKQQFGPVARHLSWAINELCKEGSLKVEKRDYFGFSKTDYYSTTRPSLARLSNSETQILQDVIDFVCARSAKEISELSHLAPWDAAEMGEVIPYYSSLALLPSAVSDADVDAAKKEAEAIRDEIKK
jgi:uncharacterized phage-associated protein